jgi:hypothetical protein
MRWMALSVFLLASAGVQHADAEGVTKKACLSIGPEALVQGQRVREYICHEGSCGDGPDPRCKDPCVTWARAQPDFEFSLDRCIENCADRFKCENR